MPRIIALRRHSSDREPLVHTTSLRKNINSQEITSSRHISRWWTLIQQPRSANLPSKLAVPSMARRCGVISARLFRIFAKITQISKQSKMEAKSISHQGQMEEASQYPWTLKILRSLHQIWKATWDWSNQTWCRLGVSSRIMELLDSSTITIRKESPITTLK